MNINLLKLGLIRDPKKDFTDDGSVFYCYRLEDYPEIRVSKTSGTIDGSKMYFIQIKVSSPVNDIYCYFDKANGMSVEKYSLEDIQNTVKSELEAAKVFINSPFFKAAKSLRNCTEEQKKFMVDTKYEYYTLKTYNTDMDFYKQFYDKYNFIPVEEEVNAATNEALAKIRNKRKVDDKTKYNALNELFSLINYGEIKDIYSFKSAPYFEKKVIEPLYYLNSLHDDQIAVIEKMLTTFAGYQAIFAKKFSEIVGSNIKID